MKGGVVTDTYYINEPCITMIEKVTIYNKALKNSFNFDLWRIEAEIIIPNFRVLALPLEELLIGHFTNLIFYLNLQALDYTSY